MKKFNANRKNTFDREVELWDHDELKSAIVSAMGFGSGSFRDWVYFALNHLKEKGLISRR